MALVSNKTAKFVVPALTQVVGSGTVIRGSSMDVPEFWRKPCLNAPKVSSWNAWLGGSKDSGRGVASSGHLALSSCIAAGTSSTGRKASGSFCPHN